MLGADRLPPAIKIIFIQNSFKTGAEDDDHDTDDDDDDNDNDVIVEVDNDDDDDLRQRFSLSGRLCSRSCLSLRAHPAHLPVPQD